MNGWLLVRIAGIVVGFATLLRVATNEGVVTYDPLFLAWMDWLSDIVELGFLTKFIGPFLHWGIEEVRSLGINLPDLQDEWRPAFVLSTLLFASIARHSRSGLLVAATPVGALAIALWSGWNGGFGPVAVAAAVVIVLTGRATVFIRVFASAALIGVAFVVAAVSDPAAFVAAIAAYKEPALPAVAGVAVIAVAAAGFLFAGLVESWSGGWRSLFDNPNFNVGIDILFTMAFAFVIAVAAANPPIW